MTSWPTLMPVSVPPRSVERITPTGAWSPGDEIGDRRFARVTGVDGLSLEAGGLLGPVDVAYETWGELDDAAGNAVLVLHALTGDSHVSGPVKSRTPEPGVVARHHRAGGSHRHEPLLRGLPECAGRMPGKHRAGIARSRRKALRVTLSHHHDS